MNSTTIRVSWGPPPRIGTYTYATVLFNGTHIFYFNVGSVTSQMIVGLKHLQTYLVLVVAMSENYYSASYVIHTLEAGMNVFTDYSRFPNKLYYIFLVTEMVSNFECSKFLTLVYN